MSARGKFAAAIWLAMVFAGHQVAAHESRPVYLNLTETGVNSFTIHTTAPVTVQAINLPVLTLPDDCSQTMPARIASAAGANGREESWHCESDLAGRTVDFAFPEFNPSISILVRVSYLTGESHSLLMAPGESNWRMPRREAAGGVAKQYFLLGTEHILVGYDHLLFLLCLLFISGGIRRIVVTVTGFTLAHSLTLALAAFQVIRLPVPPVEAAIALSILYLATEIAHGRRDTLTWRRPILVASSFGLLHGLGFAAVLGEIGLPQTEVPMALLFFNVGVEAGQLVFVFTVLALYWLAHKAIKFQPITRGAVGAPALPPVRAAATVIGSLAAFWMIDRVAGFWI